MTKENRNYDDNYRSMLYEIDYKRLTYPNVNKSDINRSLSTLRSF